MRNSLSFLALMLSVGSTIGQSNHTNLCIDVPLNSHYVKSDSLHAIMKRYAEGGLPGVAIAIYSEKDGWWSGTEGYSRLETKTPMHPCNLQYLQSVSKLYMAVAILQLHEHGQIELDAPITKYLPVKYLPLIKGASQITVRMLLNHTSGVPEFSDDPAFISFVVEHPLQKLSTEFVLHTIAGKPPMFAPGSKHYYCNTNYELLAIIADAITGDHAAFIQKNIFDRLALKNTFYRNNPRYLHNPLLVDSYWDVLNTGRPANVSNMQKANVSSYVGDDGIVCTPLDATKFLKGLMEGRLLSPASLSEMQHWVIDEHGSPVYGLGLAHYQAGDIEAFGHSGGGIGAGCILMFIPAAKTYIFFATNIGTLFEGTLATKANQLKDELLMTILQ